MGDRVVRIWLGLALAGIAPAVHAQTKLGSVLGRSAGELFGTSVTALADLDGDGRDEWAGVRGGPEGERPELLVLAARDGAVLYDRIGGGQIGLFYLPAQIDAGDLDGDGVHDFAFGNSSAPADGRSRAGRVSVYSGRTGVRLYVTSGVLSGGAFGASLASIDDLDRDGVPDLVVGQIGSQDENVWLVSGASGARLRSVHGPTPHGDPEYGWAVASVGDLDRDGSPDFAVGTLRAGVVRFYSGASGLLLRTIRGGRSFGRTLADAGDLDGDGAHELFVGESNRGLVWIVSGRSGELVPVTVGGVESLCAAGDLDGDDLTDFVVGDGAAEGERGVVRAFSSASSLVLAKLTGLHAGDRFGASVASGGADFDLDGLPDVVVGAPGVDGPQRGGDAGEASIWSLRRR